MSLAEQSIKKIILELCIGKYLDGELSEEKMKEMLSKDNAPTSSKGEIGTGYKDTITL